MANCPMCNGMRHVMTSFGHKPCPTCGGSGSVSGGSCSTCRYKGNMLDNVLNVSLLDKAGAVYCKELSRTMDGSGCDSWED